jgi:hypothetical protein
MKEQITELAEALGWKSMGAQKNAYMISFTKGERRANYYFTSSTLTIQSPTEPIETYRKVDLERAENILANR